MLTSMFRTAIARKPRLDGALQVLAATSTNTSSFSCTNTHHNRTSPILAATATATSTATVATIPHRSLSGLVPIVLENSATGERSFDIYSRLLRERIICVHGQVTDQMASVVTAQLLFLEAEAPEKPVYMYINSPGGVVTAGMAMYDTMQYIGPEVHTICMGQAASMGSLLLAGGSKGCRAALPNSRIMLHQPSGGAQGMASDIDIQAREILRTRANLNQLYVKHTHQPLDEIERVMERDFFMDVEQAVKFGVIDKILDKREDPMEDDDDDIEKNREEGAVAS